MNAALTLVSDAVEATHVHPSADIMFSSEDSTDASAKNVALDSPKHPASLAPAPHHALVSAAAGRPRAAGARASPVSAS